MFLSNKVRYAVNAIIEIASCADLKPVKLADIAEKHYIPKNYLEQIFFKLKNAGLVRSVRGPGGGYVINRDIRDITINQILQIVEENLKMTQCAIGDKCRKEGAKCKTHDLWKGLSIQIISYFSNISVADIISQKKLFDKI